MFQSYVVVLKVQGEIMWSFYGKQLQRDIQKEEGTERREIKMCKPFDNTW